MHIFQQSTKSKKTFPKRNNTLKIKVCLSTSLQNTSTFFNVLFSESKCSFWLFFFFKKNSAWFRLGQWVRATPGSQQWQFLGKWLWQMWTMALTINSGLEMNTGFLLQCRSGRCVGNRVEIHTQTHAVTGPCVRESLYTCWVAMDIRLRHDKRVSIHVF